jgi:dethiobiotin synthetase
MGARAYPPSVFVLGTDRDIGKTVTSIGIIAKLLEPELGYRIDEIGYIKPVGQQTLTVVSGEGTTIQADKDAVLVTSLMGVQSHGYEQMSPVVWGDGATADYIDGATAGDPRTGRAAFMTRIRDAFDRVSTGKRIVIIEGTGQPGVGSVAGISNADVINMLRGMGVPVFVIMVTRGGIGSTIDQVFPYLMALDHLGTRVDGLIINGVFAAKMAKIRDYLTRYYAHAFTTLYGDRLQAQGIPAILGFVPAIADLRLPTMRLIAEHLARRKESDLEILAPEDFDDGACRFVRDIKVISLEFGYEPFLEPGDAVVVGVNANDAILTVLLHHERLVRRYGSGLAGLILSCKRVGGLLPQTREIIASGDLPVITVNYDTAGVVRRIRGMTVKIQPYDEAKKKLIVRAYQEHLTLWPELRGAT